MSLLTKEMYIQNYKDSTHQYHESDDKQCKIGYTDILENSPGCLLFAKKQLVGDFP